MTKEETRKIILSKIEEIASEGEQKLQDVREKDKNGEYTVNQDGFSCDYTKDVLYDVAEDSIRLFYYLYGLVDGMFNNME